MYACSYACQKQFGHTRQTGVGRGTGELAEVVNSVLGPHGAITRYMSPANREAHIEHIARRYCGQVLLGLPARMWRMNVRATAVQRAMEERMRSMEATLGDEKQQASLYLFAGKHGRLVSIDCCSCHRQRVKWSS